MTKVNVTGKVVYKDIGIGFWGIEGNDGKNWLPMNMPEQLKMKGETVTVKVKEMNGMAGNAMWGTPVKIVSFTTV